MLNHSELFALPAADRKQLAQELLDSLDPDEIEPPINQELLDELRRREADVRNNPENDLPWETVKQQIFGGSV